MPSGFLGGGIGPVALIRQRRAAAADWWEVAGQTCVAAYQPIGAASLAASYVNLANPGTYDAAPGVAPTLAAGGWSFVGASLQYLDTGIVADIGWTALVRFSSASGNQGALLGSYTGVGNLFLMVPRNNSATNALWRYGNSEKSSIPARESGVMALAGPTGYFDGAEIVNNIGAWSGTPTRTIWIGAGNYGSVTGALTGTIAAVAIHKPTEPSTTPMSAADVAALTTRMQALA